MGCGLYLFSLMGCASVVLIIAIQRMRAAVQSASAALRAEMPTTTPHETAELGWWNLLVIPLAMVIGIGATLVVTYTFKFFLETIEYIAYCRRRCPECGARRWSWGFTRGFGL